MVNINAKLGICYCKIAAGGILGGLVYEYRIEAGRGTAYGICPDKYWRNIQHEWAIYEIGFTRQQILNDSGINALFFSLPLSEEE